MKRIDWIILFLGILIIVGTSAFTYAQEEGTPTGGGDVASPTGEITPEPSPEEIARAQAKAERIEIKQRLQQLNRIPLLAQKCDLLQPNMKVFLRDLLKDRDFSKLDCLESKVQEVKDELKAKKDIRDRAVSDCNRLKTDQKLPLYLRKMLFDKLCK